MNHLDKIQKGMNVLQILSKILLIVAYMGAALTLAGGILVAAGVLNTENQFLHFISDIAGVTTDQLTGILIAAAVSMLSGGILATCAERYFAAEQKEGTPFTNAGADRVKRLGILTIIISLVSVCITEGIYEAIRLADWNKFDDAGGVLIGICLILLSAVFRYGAELEQKDHS